jgi:hypothetical protein
MREIPRTNEQWQGMPITAGCGRCFNEASDLSQQRHSSQRTHTAFTKRSQLRTAGG